MVSKTSGASTLHRGKVSGMVQDATCHAVVMVSATVQDATCHGDCLRLLLAHHQGRCVE